MTESGRRLAKASRFLELARAEEGRDTERFVDFLETAIENGRSVTWILQKEFAHSPGFEVWHAERQRMMRDDSLMRYFKDLRTYVVKKASLAVRRVVSVTATATAYVDSSVTVKVIRGQPWYRRPLRVTWGDFKADSLQRLRAFQRKLNARRRRRSRKAEAPAIVEDHYYFHGSEFNDRPATALVEEYLERLHPIVEEAERRFGEPQEF